MNKDTLLELAERLEEVVTWRKSYDTVDTSVSITDDEYYIDFGALGEQPVYVEVSNDYYPISVSSILDHSPHDLEDLLNDLREAIDEKSTASLDDVLATMVASSNEEEAKLAVALKAVMEAMQGFSLTVVGAPLTADPSALPDKPMPWPGALREDIDYTADDFPLRYQPPPGWGWASASSSPVMVVPEHAARITCEALRKLRASETGRMVLDAKGCVSWIKRGDDTLDDEKGRWLVWMHERDGIPRGNGGFSGPTLPLPIAENGEVMNGWRDLNGRACAWKTDADAERAAKRIAEIREEYEKSSNGSKEVKSEFEAPAAVSL